MILLVCLLAFMQYNIYKIDSHFLIILVLVREWYIMPPQIALERSKLFLTGPKMSFQYLLNFAFWLISKTIYTGSNETTKNGPLLWMPDEKSLCILCKCRSGHFYPFLCPNGTIDFLFTLEVEYSIEFYSFCKREEGKSLSSGSAMEFLHCWVKIS